MIVQCDVCKRFYEQDVDDHDMGEMNFCCMYCVWTVSNCGEPQPKHTCVKIKPKEKVEFT